MKITVTLAIEVDPEAWTRTYGVAGAQDIRADVKRYIEGSVADSAAAQEGCVTAVTVR